MVRIKNKLGTAFAACFIFFLLFTTINVALADDSDELSVDLEKQSEYNSIHDEEGIEIYYANTNSHHFFFIESEEAFHGDLLIKTDKVTYNLGYKHSNHEIKTKMSNVTAEIRLSQEYGNEIEFFLNGKSIKLTVEPEYIEEPPSPWTGYTIAILFLLGWIGTVAGINVKNKKYIEAYVSKIDENGNLTTSEELEVIGEWKREFANHQRGCIDFEMRSGTHRFIAHSTVSFFNYKAYHRVRNYLWVRFLIRAHLFEKEIDEPYETKLGWGLMGHLHRFITTIFNWNFYALVASPFIWAVLLSFMFPNFYPIIGIGVGVGWGVNTLVYYMQKDGKWIPKRKTITVTKEKFLAPLESEWIKQYVFKVKGKKMTVIKTKDEAKQVEYRDFTKKVVGYDALYEIRNKDDLELESWEIVDQTRKRRSPTEMKQLQMSFLRRNMEITDEIFTLRRQNAELVQKLKESQKEKNEMNEQYQRDIVNTVNEMKMASRKRGNTLIKILEDEFGRAYVRDNLDASVERAERIVQAERDKAKANKMEKLISLMYELIDMIGSKADLRTESLKNLIMLKEEQEKGGNNGASK